jgi:tetratricopeptide (TPR) repeat protein
MFWTGRLSAVSTILVLVTVGAPSAQAPPPLPELAMERFPEAARASVSRALGDAKAHPSDAKVVGQLGRVLHAWDQYESAHAAYSRAAALAPKAFEWPYLDAVVLQRLARHAEAATRLKEVLAISPNFKPATVKLADALFDAGNIDESRRLFEKLVKDPETEPMGDFGLGRIAVAEKRYDEAIARLERAVARFPEWGSAHYSLAMSYRALGRREEAQQALERHAKYGPQWPTLEDPVLATISDIRDDARALLVRGIRLAELGDLEGAIKAHEAALAQDPSLLQAHMNLISLYGRAGRFNEGEQQYLESVKLGGETADMHYDFGVLLGLQQKWDEAGAAYEKAIAANPSHARARNNLGETLERRRRVEAALEAYRGAVEVAPGFRLARFNASRMLLALGRAGEAVSELEKIVEPRDAEAPRYLFALSVAYLRAGRKDEAIKWAHDAKGLAVEFGQKELAAAIERDLALLK